MVAEGGYNIKNNFSSTLLSSFIESMVVWLPSGVLKRGKWDDRRSSASAVMVDKKLISMDWFKGKFTENSHI